jgi:hypothetical protein
MSTPGCPAMGAEPLEEGKFEQIYQVARLASGAAGKWRGWMHMMRLMQLKTEKEADRENKTETDAAWPPIK